MLSTHPTPTTRFQCPWTRGWVFASSEQAGDGDPGAPRTTVTCLGWHGLGVCPLSTYPTKG